MRENVNKNITVKLLTKADLYDGLYVMSIKNPDFIYKVGGNMTYISNAYEIFYDWNGNRTLRIPDDRRYLNSHSLNGVELCETTLTTIK
jgi:hypothetical protein